MRNHGVSPRLSKPGAKNAFGIACGEESKLTSSDPIQFIGPLTRDLARKLGGGVMGLLLVTGRSDVRNRPSVIKRCPSPLLDEGRHSHSLWWPERRPKVAVVMFLGVSYFIGSVCAQHARSARGKRSWVLTRMRAHENRSWTTQGSFSAACARNPPSLVRKSYP